MKSLLITVTLVYCPKSETVTLAEMLPADKSRFIGQRQWWKACHLRRYLLSEAIYEVSLSRTSDLLAGGGGGFYSDGGNDTLTSTHYPYGMGGKSFRSGGAGGVAPSTLYRSRVLTMDLLFNQGCVI